MRFWFKEHVLNTNIRTQSGPRITKEQPLNQKHINKKQHELHFYSK